MSSYVADVFEKEVDKWEEELRDLPLSHRHDVVNYVCESYVLMHGKKPDSYQLMRLANVLLLEVLSNPDTYKMQNEEYPVLSIPQQKRRSRREFVAKDSTLAYMDFKVNENLSTSPTVDNR